MEYETVYYFNPDDLFNLDSIIKPFSSRGRRFITNKLYFDTPHLDLESGLSVWTDVSNKYRGKKILGEYCGVSEKEEFNLSESEFGSLDLTPTLIISSDRSQFIIGDKEPYRYVSVDFLKFILPDRSVLGEKRTIELEVNISSHHELKYHQSFFDLFAKLASSKITKAPNSKYHIGREILKEYLYDEQ